MKLLKVPMNNFNINDYRLNIVPPTTAKNNDSNSKTIPGNASKARPPHSYCVHVSGHRDAMQLQCDIDRSLWSYSNYEQDASMPSWIADNLMHRRRISLSNIILAVLGRHRELFYYQGYHDIASIFLTVFDYNDAHAFEALAAVSMNTHIRDIMRPDFGAAVASLSMIVTLLGAADHLLCDCILKYLYVETPVGDSALPPDYSNTVMFALCNLITWFSHDIKNEAVAAWIMDVFLASPACYPIYYITAVSRSHVTYTSFYLY
jgi:hypothetical protein